MDDDFEIEITDLRAERAGPDGDLHVLPRPVRLNGLNGTGTPADQLSTWQTDDAQPRSPRDGVSVMVEASDLGARQFPSALTREAPSRLPADEAFDIEFSDLSGQPVDSVRWLADLSRPDGIMGRMAAWARHRLWPGSRHGAPRATGAARQAARRRLAGGLGALGALLAALLVVLSGSPVPQALRTRLFATPTATAVGANTLLLANTVPWGQLRVDGKRTTPNSFGNEGVVNLSGGQHEIEYDAPPFPRLRCHLSVPAAQGDNCPQSAQSQGPPLVTFGAARLLDMGASVSRLAPGPLAQLTRAVQGMLVALAASTTINPGDHYSVSDAQVVVARQTLHATLRPVLNTDPAAAPNINGATCVTFCDNQGDYGNGFSESGWTVLVNVRSEWDIARLDGTLVGAAQAAIPGAPAGASLLSLPVALTWANGGWQIASQQVTGLANPASFDVGNLELCTIAQQLVPPLSNNFTGNGATGSCLVASNPADGCVVTWQADDGSGNPIGATAYLLYRFGVLLAANQVAIKGFPNVTVANSQEQALAQRIVASGGFPGQIGTTSAIPFTPTPPVFTPPPPDATTVATN